ncbi:efflux RND transporter periplasmic adaptor subunit [Glaciecola sp. MH2013]|uniref:efflux RND transporter periplasmic adaptor subunit n=1 Tax=Glaciecola sp. MH2013 TaxID=2785524 RepID=UPI00189DE71A|nr:efflux RND transporter periplasmic adaptor subunit [Glaciecola sp. MH2013]MBF7073468.1 efflux RND transporter periplasmic adaptor subunit [Glaciecola sp. MH2013]
MKKPHIIAIVMTLIIVLWMASGIFSSNDGVEEEKKPTQANQKMLVQVEDKNAERVFLTLTIQGQVEPNRQVSIRSDLKGRIASLKFEEGDFVQAGEVLASLDIEDREIRLERQKALLKSRQESYKRTKTLSQSSLQSQSMLEDAFAELKAAESELAQLEFEISKLNILAPFDGIVESRTVEAGSFVNENAEIAQLVDNRTLKVIAPVAQRDIQKVSLGKLATIKLATGEELAGKVSFISPVANQSTRTFRVEILLDNENGDLPAGMSAEIHIPTVEVNAHFISPAILALDTAGNIGVKTVTDNAKVEFHSIDIVKSETAGLWVTGLPPRARIITIGQGFVEAGAAVDIQIAGAQ